MNNFSFSPRSIRPGAGARLLAVLALALLMVACQAPTHIAKAQVRLLPVTDGLKKPLAIAHAGDERLFVVEQAGLVRVVKDDKPLAEPFLDLSAQVTSSGEQGLLGLAFPPDYASSGRFYVYYTDLAGDSVLSRFSVTSGNPDRADAASEEILLQQDQPHSNHNGGQLAFGPDGYLYLGLGDGGSGGDPDGNGQNLGTLLGKLLRLDVSGTSGYDVPAANPFVSDSNARGEIWAYGLRNPWRFSFDNANGDLYIADVGQNAYEEVNFQLAGSEGGENYGWNIMEADSCFKPSNDCDKTGLVMPVVSYPHGAPWGNSITGGYVYRGEAVSDLVGRYLFADFGSGRVWSTSAASDWAVEPLFETGFAISTFGEGADGELYVVDYSAGALYRIIKQ